MSPAISCRDLRKRYPARPAPVDAVDGLDLEVRTGECFGLLGPNGAGKTTTVEIFQGLLEPTSGDVLVLGLCWGQHDAQLRQRLGTSLQETKFPDRLTVEEVVRLFRSFYTVGPEHTQVLDAVSLTEKKRARIDKLSGGQRQRLAVACALVGDPDLLFLDEPTTGLDPQSRRQIWDVVQGFKARGRTVVLTTHYMDEAERLCDRVAVVDHGKVIAMGSPAELIRSLGGDHVLEFALLGEGAITEAEWLGIASAIQVRAEADGFVLMVAEPHRAVPALLQFLERRGRELSRLSTRHATLEDVFVKLTGRHLRDDTL